MAKVKVELELPKEAYELGVGVKRFVLAMKKALDDGWQMDQDVSVALKSAITDLAPAVKGVDQLDDEAKADPISFGQALALPLSDVGKAFLKMDEPQDPPPAA